MPKITDELEYIKNDIMERCISELSDYNLTISYTVSELKDHPIKELKKNLLETFLLEKTDRTDNENDFIPTMQLWDKYEDWRLDKYVDNEEVFKTTDITSAKMLGMLMNQIGKYEKDQRKTGRGYKKLKWKGDSSKILIFITKMIIKTDERDKIARQVNRISPSEMVQEYYKWLDREYPEESQRKEKVPEPEFILRLRKNGYETNTGYLHREVVKANGKVKIERTTRERILYVGNVKWLPGINDLR